MSAAAESSSQHGSHHNADGSVDLIKSEEVLIPMSLSEDNLRMHTKAHTSEPKADFETMIRSWASNVNMEQQDDWEDRRRDSPTSSTSEFDQIGRRMAGMGIRSSHDSLNSGGQSRSHLQHHHPQSHHQHKPPHHMRGSLPNLRSGYTQQAQQQSRVGGGQQPNLSAASSHGAIHLNGSQQLPNRSSNPNIADKRSPGGSREGLPPPSPTSRSVNGSKLVCRLKVETEKGQYQMLPVHENDDPLELAQSFCRDYSLPSWVSSLENHIRVAKRTYA
ncbi:hypothetical protein DFJ77DRAFT_478895 [Powellomyces hirtus]|nr:hypothetical protein DFJ77DRAFT_478895 [Powellomyces hirtus]